MAGQVCSKPKRGPVPSEGQDRGWGVIVGPAESPQPHQQHPQCHKTSYLQPPTREHLGSEARHFQREQKMLHISVSFEFFRFP